MIETKPPVQRVNRRISLQATNRIRDQHLSNDIVSLIVDHQYALFKHKQESLEKTYTLESTEEKNRKILNDWIYIASSYCYILAENDLEYCDELAVELFSAYYIICKMVFIKVRGSSVDYNNANLEDRQNMNIMLNKYDDFLASGRRDYYQAASIQIDSLATSIDNNNNDLYTPSRSLDPNTVKEQRESKGSPDDFYPQIEDDGDYASSASSSESIDIPLKNIDSRQSTPSSSIIRSIDAGSLMAMDPKTVVILNIQSRKIHTSSRHVLNLDDNSITDDTYFNANVVPYLHESYYIVFFTRSPSISKIERYVYNKLTSLGLENCFWLNGGYSAFKSEFFRTKAAKEEQTKRMTQTPPPPPIPTTKPLITTPFNDSLQSQTLATSTSGFNSQQPSTNNFLYPIATPPTIDANSNQRYSHSYSSLNDSNSMVSNNDFAQHQKSVYASTEASLRKLALSNKSLQNISQGDGVYNSVQSKSLTTNSSAPPSSLPPIPPVPPTQPIVTTATIPSVPIVPPPNPYMAPAPQVYKLSRLDYKPTVSLKNLGSTCYINSMIQCLFSLTKFRHFFINDDKLKTYIRDLNNRNLKLTSGFHDLFATFYDKSPHGAPSPVIDISKFLSIIARLNPSYHIPNEQQDTSQFFYYIIDELHKELKFKYSLASQLGMVSVPTDKGEKFYDWQTKLLQNEGYSFTQNLFNIKEAVVMKCNRCGYVSTRYDTSIMVHLSLKSTSCTLNDILSQNFVPEEMSTKLGNAWDCDGCTKIDKDLEILQEKLEIAHDMNLAASMKDKGTDHEKEKKKSKDKQKDKSLAKRLFGRHNKPKSSSKEDKEDDRNESTSDLGDFAFTALTEHERSEYNRLADIYTRERIAYRSVEFIELPDVLVLCLSLFNPNQQDAKVIMKNLKFPETLNMKYNQGTRLYKLNSWIDHLGSTIDSGHYTATVPYPTNSYIVCDDDRLLPPQNIYNHVVSDNDVYLLFYEAFV